MDDSTQTGDVGKDVLGEVSDTLSSTDIGGEQEVLPSTEVLDILPMIEPEVTNEKEA